MARKKVITCESCGTREYMEKSIEVELKTGDKIYFCCEHCKDVTSDEEILNKEIFSMIKHIIGVKTMGKTVNGYIRNRLKDDFDGDKRQILFTILSEKRYKLTEIISKKTFPNSTIKAKYVFASVEKDVEQELQRKTKQDERITFVTFDEPISVSRTTKKRKSIRDFL